MVVLVVQLCCKYLNYTIIYIRGECEMEKEYIHEEMLELEDLELDEEDLLIRAGKTLG